MQILYISRYNHLNINKINYKVKWLELSLIWIIKKCDANFDAKILNSPRTKFKKRNHQNYCILKVNDLISGWFLFHILHSRRIRSTFHKKLCILLFKIIYPINKKNCLKIWFVNFKQGSQKVLLCWVYIYTNK
jgi:hypothetical protein